MIVTLFIINTELLNICFPIYKHKDLTKAGGYILFCESY